ncbi:hypothetical protein VPH35_137577 [Triticum aestivum]
MVSIKFLRCMNGQFLQLLIQWTYGVIIVSLRSQHTMTQMSSEDYGSNTLWDEYIKNEESLQAWSHLAVVYTRILEHPIKQLDRYFNWHPKISLQMTHLFH